jgi:hypothetical protein
MGEIKSTLELVMERTRHLSLSDEDRARQQKADFDNRLRGLLQQYADGVLTIDALKDRIACLRTELDVIDRRALVAGVVSRIDPDQDNRRWLDLLGVTDPALGHHLEKILFDYSCRKGETLQKKEDQSFLNAGLKDHLMLLLKYSSVLLPSSGVKILTTIKNKIGGRRFKR